MAYASLALTKSYLGITETTDDALLQQLLDASQTAIDGFCRQTFEAAIDTTRYFDAVANVDGPKLMLDAPLAVITTVTNGDSTTVLSSKYVTNPRNQAPYHALVLKSNAGIAWTYTSTPENAIVITGRWAYSTTVPADISQVTVRMAAYLYRQKSNSSDLDRPVAIPGNAMLLPPELPKDIKMFLVNGGYRRVVV